MNYSCFILREPPPSPLQMFYVLHTLSSASYFIVLQNKIRRRGGAGGGDREFTKAGLMFLSRETKRGSRERAARAKSGKPFSAALLRNPVELRWREEKSRVRGINCRTNHRRRFVTEQAVSSPSSRPAQDGNSRAAGSAHGDCSAASGAHRWRLPVGEGPVGPPGQRTVAVVGVRTLGT